MDIECYDDRSLLVKTLTHQPHGLGMIAVDSGYTVDPTLRSTVALAAEVNNPYSTTSLRYLSKGDENEWS